MFKIIELDTCNVNQSNILVEELLSNTENYNLSQLKNNQILQKNNFDRTLAGIGSKDILDLDKRSSWTHKFKFKLDLPVQSLEFFEQNNIVHNKCEYFTLLKYETGDFFLNHRDKDLSDDLNLDLNFVSEGLTHKYTCLIYCPYGDDYMDLEGGELIFTHPNKLYEIKFDASIETKQNHFVMVIFSIDMYHQVLPIIKGTRFVFKKPLFVKNNSAKIEEKNKTVINSSFDELDDGGYNFSCETGGGDY